MLSRIERIIRILDDKKAEDAEFIDMSGQEYIAKYVIIAPFESVRYFLPLTETSLLVTTRPLLSA